MPVIAKRRNYSVTPLDLIGLLLKNAGKRFNDIGKDIDEIFIIGDWLSSPFIYIGGWLLYGELKAKEANKYLKDVMEWTYTIIDGLGFYDLLDWSSIWLKWLRTDRRLFLRTLLTGYVTEGYLLLDNPRQWIINRIVSYSLWFMLFLNNPENFIISKLTIRAFWIVSFLNNPILKIVEWLKAYNWKLAALLLNPTSFIITSLFASYLWFSSFVLNPQNFIVDKLKLYSIFLYNLITRKELFIYELIGKALGLPSSFVANPLGVMMDFLLLRLEQSLDLYIDRLKNIIIKFILKFI